MILYSSEPFASSEWFTDLSLWNILRLIPALSGLVQDDHLRGKGTTVNKYNGRVAKGIIIAGILIAVIFYFTKQTPIIIAVEGVLGSYLVMMMLAKVLPKISKW